MMNQEMTGMNITPHSFCADQRVIPEACARNLAKYWGRAQAEMRGDSSLPHRQHRIVNNQVLATTTVSSIVVNAVANMRIQ